jgi:hypothetical protein
MKYRVIQMVEGRMMPWETTDIFAAMEVRGVEYTGPLPERRARVMRPELRDQPTFRGFAGPMWDGDAIRYEDSASYERLSA